MTVKKKTEPQPQLLVCHNASMECYRRAMIREQTFEGRRENQSRQGAVQQRASLALASTILCEAGARPVSQKGG
jgi:hypothetical protein